MKKAINETSRRQDLEAAWDRNQEPREPKEGAKYLSKGHPIDRAVAIARTLQQNASTPDHDQDAAHRAGVDVAVIRRLRSAFARKAAADIRAHNAGKKSAR